MSSSSFDYWAFSGNLEHQLTFLRDTLQSLTTIQENTKVDYVTGVVPQQLKIFNTWRLYLQIRAIEKCQKLSRIENPTFVPPTDLLAEAIRTGRSNLKPDGVEPRALARWNEIDARD